MRYEYISTYQIFGLNQDTAKGDMEVYRSDDNFIRAILTSDVNSHCHVADRGRAIGLIMLRGFSGEGAYENFNAALEKEIKAIQEQRIKDIGTSVILLIHITGEINVTINEPMQTIDDFSFGFDLIDKESIKASHNNTISVIVSAVCLSTDPPTDVRRLIDDVCFQDEAGNYVYSVSFSVFGELYTSKLITEDVVELISSQAKDLMSIENLGRVTKLLMMTSDKKNDRLRSFLTGWSALEIFLNKAFLFYEQEFISQGFTDNVPSGIKRYIERIKEAIERGKYSLLDKFMMIAAFLGSDTIEADVELFRKLKDARDDFFHKQEIVDNNLPVAELRALLTRYLRAHIEFIKSPDR